MFRRRIGKVFEDCIDRPWVWFGEEGGVWHCFGVFEFCIDSQMGTDLMICVQSEKMEYDFVRLTYHFRQFRLSFGVMGKIVEETKVLFRFKYQALICCSGCCLSMARDVRAKTNTGRLAMCLGTFVATNQSFGDCYCMHPICLHDIRIIRNN